jgi:hypothetical protein
MQHVRNPIKTTTNVPQLKRASAPTEADGTIACQVEIVEWWIHLTTATVEFFFAPAERDVYSSSALKDLAPLGAKPGEPSLGMRERLRSRGAPE